jgi:signal transduction histidine kinase
MVGSIINVTNRKLAEEKIIKQKDLLEKANAELDRFVYITSHDLKAPLLSIQGLIHLAEISEDKSEVEMCLKMMMERIKGLENFIADIIDYSRNVRIGLVSEEIKLKNLIEKIYKDLFYLENVDKIDFQINVDDNLTFKSDEKRVNVILKNLIFNAVKYQNFKQKKPSITVSANEDGNNLEISVNDNGEGIDPEIQDKIYDMFFRASEKSSGSGLGLYIVKEMVNKLGGNINLKSKVGKGSEFIVRIPVSI